MQSGEVDINSVEPNSAESKQLKQDFFNLIQERNFQREIERRAREAADNAQTLAARAELMFQENYAKTENEKEEIEEANKNSNTSEGEKPIDIKRRRKGK